MADGRMSLRYLILGLLARQPMSGYDIKRFLQGLSWLIGSPSSGSLYPVLRSLLQEGSVTVETIPSVARPPKKIYSITQAGEQILDAWMEQPATADTPLKAFVMRLLLATNLPHARLVAHLEQRRAQAAAQQDALKLAIGQSAEKMDLGQRLAQDYGLALASAELAWLDNALGRLCEQSLTENAGWDQSEWPFQPLPGLAIDQNH